MDPHNLKKLNEARAGRQAVVLVSELDTGRDRVVLEGTELPGALGDAVGKAFRSGKSGVVETAGGSFFLNAHLPPPRLVVIGAVHISQALAPIAKLANFDVSIIDPRTAFATPERFADTTLHAEWPEDVLNLDRFTALAAVTHDPKIDDYPLFKAVETGCFYVGALGSRKTHAKRVERLMERGLSEEAVSTIHAPIGLDIGAANPVEIAIATMAEIISALRRRAVTATED